MTTSKIEKLPTEYAEQMANLHALGFAPAWPVKDFIAHCESEFDDVRGVMVADRLVGFVVLRAQQDQAEVLTIIVDPKKRGLGLGASLLEGAERAAQQNGVEIVFLDVAKDNLAAISMYRNAGYVQCGVRAGYYRRVGGRVDALLFQKHLS